MPSIIEDKAHVGVSSGPSNMLAIHSNSWCSKLHPHEIVKLNPCPKIHATNEPH
jgi:hypothetical protein